MNQEDKRATCTSRIIQAEPEEVYRCFVDPGALIEWLPPGEMSATIGEFDARVGGGYVMSLFYPESEEKFRGKTTEKEDRVRVRFVELDPPRRLVEAIDFVTEDPSLCGEMTMEANFDKVKGGTEVTLRFTHLPQGLRPEDNDAGARISLEQLAQRFES